MIRFLAPAFLGGLALVLVPLALHLLHRRRVPVVPFPLAKLLARADRTRQPRRRLNRVLLLATRVALLAVLALALARALVGGSASAVASTGPVAVAVVVDDSLSTGARATSGETVLGEGIRAAQDLLARLPDGSFAAVLRATDPGEGERAGLSADVEEAGRVLAATRGTLRHATLGPALSAAARVLAAAPVPERRVVLVTDVARHAFAGGLGLDAPAEGPLPLFVVAANRAEDAVNASVTGLDVKTMPDGRARVSLRAAAWGPSGARAGEVPVEILAGPLDGALRVAARATLSPRPGASVERVEDLVLPESGPVRVVARLAADDLPADDAREAAHHAARRPSVLVVDGDPQNIALGSEAFYVERALAQGVGLDVDAEVVTLASLSAASALGKDALVLCNVPELSDDRLAATLAAVSAGAGLVVSLGDRVDQRAWNGRLAALLPARLAGPVEPPAPILVERGARPIDLPRVTVRKHFVLEQSAGAEVLARLADGSPLVVSGRVGSGTSVLLATTLDRGWTDLPISPQFLAFLRGLLDEAIGRRDERVLAPVSVGDDVALAAALGSLPAEPLVLRSPDGGRAAVPDDGILRGLEQPGVHALEAEGRVVALIPVVTDPVESDLARLGEAEFAEALAPAFDVVGAEGGARGVAGGWPAWKACLVALPLLAMGEAVLARRAA